MHALASTLTGGAILPVTEAEAEQLARSAAQILMSDARYKPLRKSVERHAPWLGFSLIAATIYAPQLVAIFRAPRRAKRAGVVSIDRDAVAPRQATDRQASPGAEATADSTPEVN